MTFVDLGVDSGRFPAPVAPTVSAALPASRYSQDQSSRHRVVLRDSRGDDDVPTTAAQPQWPRVFPGI